MKTHFEIKSGPVEVGLGDFYVCVNEQTWSGRASYIDVHPLCGLIKSSVDLYHHFFVSPFPLENAVWDSMAMDEPGGIAIRATPAEGEKKVRIQIFVYTDEFMPKLDKLPDVLPVADFELSYWDYAEAVFKDAARAIARQGFTGFRSGWEPSHWESEFEEVLPVELFLYLGAIIKFREPQEHMGLAEEISLLQEILERQAG